MTNYIGTVKKLSAAASIIRRDGNLGVRYHDTIVAEKQGNALVIRSGGWETPTTKKWINFAISLWLDGAYSLYQENWTWYVLDRTTDKIMPFTNGMTLYPVKEG